MKPDTAPSTMPAPTARATPGAWRAPALWAGCLLCYTLSWVLAKSIVREVPPVWAGAGRLLASFCVLTLILAFQRGQRLRAHDIRQRAWPILSLAVLGFAGYFTLTFVALRLLPPTDLVVVLSLMPGLTYLLGIWLFGDAANALKTLGITIATACVIVFQQEASAGLSAGRWAGVALGLLAAVGYALYGLLYGRTMKGLPVLGLLPVFTGLATMMAVVLALALEGIPTLPSWRALLSIACIGAFLSAPVYVMFNQLVLQGHALMATLVGVVGPFTVLLLEQALGLRTATGGEVLLMAAAAGGVMLVLRGQALSNRQRMGRATP